MSATDFKKHFPDVSRETIARLETYANLLAQWQPRINLVGPKTLAEMWSRHFIDSAQLLPLLPPGIGRLADFGSGAGFPGLVLAILGVPDVQLVESDQRKCIFMREVARATEANVTVHNSRIESLRSLQADVITARALAPLDELLPLTLPHLKQGGTALFLKGSGWQGELEAARPALAAAHTVFHVKHFPSLTAPDGVILRLSPEGTS